MVKTFLSTLILASTTVCVGTAIAGNGDKWTCVVDGAEIKVKGKNPKAKKKACEAKGGTLEKQQASSSGGTSTPPAGGSW